VSDKIMSTGDVTRRAGLQQPAPRSRPGSSPRRMGYARVSTKAQELERQIPALKAERCHDIFKDTASGKSLAGRSSGRPSIARARRRRCAGPAVPSSSHRHRPETAPTALRIRGTPPPL